MQFISAEYTVQIDTNLESANSLTAKKSHESYRAFFFLEPCFFPLQDYEMVVVVDVISKFIIQMKADKQHFVCGTGNVY